MANMTNVSSTDLAVTVEDESKAANRNGMAKRMQKSKRR